MFSKLLTSARFLNRKLNYFKVTRACCNDAGGAEQRGVVICCYENNKQLELSPAGAELDQKCGGKISQQLNAFACDLHLGKAFAITCILEYSAVAIASIGPKDACYNVLESIDEARENIRWGVGAGVMLLKERGCVTIEVDPCTAPDAAAEAAELAAWRFEVFKCPKVKKPPCVVCCYGEASPLWMEGCIRGRAQNWARCLSDMPANKMTPVDLAQAALDVLCPLGVTVEAHDRDWIAAQHMQAFLAVARGSCETPMFLECEYKGAGPNTPPVLLAAKGVTFDSGGLCLKECHSMTENRGSMAGAAVVLAAFQIIAQLKLPINVTGVIPICENMVSGQCMKVGDVVQALNGMSIQIENTDMEGRLMMADALVYGQSIHKPSLVIDVATFTHGVLMATGGGAFGVFSNCESAWRALCCAGAASGDRPWRFPLWHYFHKLITNDCSVDLRNKGCGYATPCLGAAFLKNFVCGDWLHMDITGVGKVAHSGAPPYLDKCRMTGRPTRTLAILIQHIALASCTPPAQPCPPCPPCPPQPVQPCPPQPGQPCPPQPSQPCPPQPSQPCPPQPGQPCEPQPRRPCRPQPSPPCQPPPSPPCQPQPSPPCQPQPSPPCQPQPRPPCQPQPSPPCQPQPSPPRQPQPSPPCRPQPSPPCQPQPSPPCQPQPSPPRQPQPSPPCQPQPSPPRQSQPSPPCQPQPSPPCQPQPSPPCQPQPSPPRQPQPSPPCQPQPSPPRQPQPSPPCQPQPRPPCQPQPGPPCQPQPRPPCQQSPPQPCPPCQPQPGPPCQPSPPRPPCQPSPPQPRPPCQPQPSPPCQPCQPQPPPPCQPSPPSQPCQPSPPSQPCQPSPPSQQCPPGPQKCPPSTQSCAPKPCHVPLMKHKCS